MRQSRGVEWAAQEVALAELAAELEQDVVLSRGLDSLGHDAQLERVRHPDDAGDERPLSSIRAEAGHEDPVDLELVEGEAGEAPERRESSPEVIDGQPHTGSAEPVHGGPQLGLVADQGALGDLERERRGGDPGGGQELGDAIGEGRLHELLRSDVHRHREVVAGQACSPRRECAQGRLDDPVADAHDHAGLFGNRDELIRRDGPEHRAGPSQQGFEPDQLIVVEAVERLVVQREFPPRIRSVQRLAQASRSARARQVRCEGVVERGIGVHERGRRCSGTSTGRGAAGLGGAGPGPGSNDTTLSALVQLRFARGRHQHVRLDAGRRLITGFGDRVAIGAVRITFGGDPPAAHAPMGARLVVGGAIGGGLATHGRGALTDGSALSICVGLAGGLRPGVSIAISGYLVSVRGALFAIGAALLRPSSVARCGGCCPVGLGRPLIDVRGSLIGGGELLIGEALLASDPGHVLAHELVRPGCFAGGIARRCRVAPSARHGRFWIVQRHSASL